jgi:hypothetical protein
MNDNPIFILGAHKSGTTLLRSIFDGHSQLFAIPFEPHPFQQLGYWIDNEYRKQPPIRQNNQEFIASCINWIHHCNTTLDEMGDNFMAGKINEEAFELHLRKQISNNSHTTELIKAYYDSIYYSLHQDSLPAELRILDKSVENAEFAIDLQRAFPEAQFIHIVRNPYANAVSLRRYKSRDFGYPVLSRLYRTLHNSYYFLYRNQKIIDNYHIVQYENLVKDPEKIIYNLCENTDLGWEQILQTPTLNGEAWGGNSTTGKKFSGISADHIDRWKQQIDPVEVYYINRLFPFVIKDYGYEFYEKDGSFWAKAKGENLKRYIANRLYRYYLIED